jgi:hypothetical protein
MNIIKHIKIHSTLFLGAAAVLGSSFSSLAQDWGHLPTVVQGTVGRNLAPGERVDLGSLLNLPCSSEINHVSVEAAALNGESWLSLSFDREVVSQQSVFDRNLNYVDLFIRTPRRLCNEFRFAILSNSGFAPIYVGGVTASVSNLLPPLPPPPPPPPPPQQQCREFDQGKLKVKPGKKESITLTCPANWARTGQRYTGTSSLDCDWSKSWGSAKLTCKNNNSKTLDADHVYISCCGI